MELRIAGVEASDVEQGDVRLVADLLKNKSEWVRWHREAFERLDDRGESGTSSNCILPLWVIADLF